MSEHNPWKTIKSRIVYKNPWITVREDDVIRPDGKEGIYGVVETRVATGVVAITRQREVYLVGQYRYAMNEYSWEIVEGGSDLEESPVEAARRELREEAGLIAQIWTKLGGDIHLSNCHSSEVGCLFLAEGLSETEKEPEGTEVLQIRKMPITDAISMVDSGEIKDVMSIIGLLRAFEVLKARKKS